MTADSQPAAGGLASGVAAIAVAYRGNAEPPDALAAEIVSVGGIAREFGSDMADPGAVEQLVEDVEAAFGSVDILVANHSVAPQARFEDVDAAMFGHTLAVHLRAPLPLAGRALSRMRERGLGRVLFISSVAAFRGVSSVPTTPVLRPGPTTAQTALQ
jgi:3-oxoacyl-[acyl-carrier protein] reductase